MVRHSPGTDPRFDVPAGVSVHVYPVIDVRRGRPRKEGRGESCSEWNACGHVGHAVEPLAKPIPFRKKNQATACWVALPPIPTGAKGARRVGFAIFCYEHYAKVTRETPHPSNPGKRPDRFGVMHGGRRSVGEHTIRSR